MTKSEWCKYHGITEEEAQFVEDTYKYFNGKIDKVLPYEWLEHRKIIKQNNINKLFSRR